MRRVRNYPNKRNELANGSGGWGKALFLNGVEVVIDPRTSLAPDARLEPVHIHGVDDTSIHLCVPPERGMEIIAAGWAIPHQYGDYGTELLVFAPRTPTELHTVLGFIAESLDYARAANSPHP